MGDGQRALHMIHLAQPVPADEGGVRYTGVDLFEARPGTRCGLVLRTAYRTLRATGAAVRLLPGDVATVFHQFANDLGPVDLLVISPDVPPESLSRAWFYVPRMLHSESLVYLQESAHRGTTGTRLLSLDEINQLAQQATVARRAA